MRLVQIRRADRERRVGVVKGERLLLLDRVDSIYDLAQQAIAAAGSLGDYASELISKQSLSYDEVYDGRSEWRLLPAIDHPQEPARCMVSGTGLTHLKSAQNRQAMHALGRSPDRQHAYVRVGGSRREAGTRKNRHVAGMVLQGLWHIAASAW